MNKGFSHQINVMLICGVKSASTWLANCLRQHPEINYFQGQDLDFDFSKNELINIKNFDKNVKKKILISRRNLSPIVLKKPYAEALFNNNPRMKFVSLLREPISRSLSNIRHTALKFPFRQWPDSFKKSITDYSFNNITIDCNVIIKEELNKKVEDRHHTVLSSQYGLCISPFLKLFPRKQFLLLPLTYKMQNLSSNYEKIIRFLGLPKQKNKPENFEKVVNRQKEKKTTFFDKIFGYKNLEFLKLNSESIELLENEYRQDIGNLKKNFSDINFEKYWNLS